MFSPGSQNRDGPESLQSDDAIARALSDPVLRTGANRNTVR